MGRLDWVRPFFAMQGNQHSTSRADEIMAKYRPIAPKPPLLTTSSLGKPTNSSDSTISALDFLSSFSNTHKRRYCNGGYNRSHGYKRRASDCFQGHSPRVLKKSRGCPSIPSEGKINRDIKIPRVEVDGPEVLQTSMIDKELETLESGEANAFNRSSVLDKRYGGSDQWVGIKMVMESIGEVGVENPASNVQDVSVPKVAETQCGCGSAKFFVFPIVGDIHQEEEKNLVTLPLLPQTPPLQKASIASLRLFGRDLSHREVGSCQISNNESPKPEKVVPIVGLSFI
ncbi:hypothetical protein SUGI_0576160 [Cryptomeria japonica]|nr:hypothetical protein SUGI_0576160 [Cryptomeria japonica]